MIVASLVIAAAALLFTVASFWWLQARRGRLSCFPVQTFSGFLAADSAVLRIPLTIFNSGAVPIVVADLRLRMRTPEAEDLLMHFRSFRKSLLPESGDVHDFAHPFSIPGRDVVARHVEFASLVGPASLVSGNSAVAVVEALLDHDDQWIELGRFPVHVEIMAHTGTYVTYSNRAHVWPPGLAEQAAASFTKLRRKMGLTST